MAKSGKGMYGSVEQAFVRRDEPKNGSLRSKRFRAVSEERKTEERDSRFWPPEKWPLLQNSTETLASQAIKTAAKEAT